MHPLQILETCLYAEDLAAAEQFYGDLLGLSVVSRQTPRHIFFRCDKTMLLLFNPEVSGLPSAEVPPHGAHGPGHVAFSVGSGELPDWEMQLAEHGVAIEKRVTWPNGSVSLYFRDPAGNSVELTSPRIWRISSDRTELACERLLLRRYRENDREDFIALNCEPLVREHMNGPLTPASAEALFTRLLSDCGNDRSFSWAMIERASGRFVGHAFIDADSDEGEPELGFLFQAADWGRGLATEAVRRIIGFVFTETALSTLVATVDSDHRASIRVLEKTGFELQATRQDEHGTYYVYVVARQPNG